MAEFSNKTVLTKFDVIKFAKNILNEIEEVRSFDNAFDEQTDNNFKIANESRINAFFRLIGLPMFVSVEDKVKVEGAEGKKATGLRSMSPGYSAQKDRIDLLNYNIKNAEKNGDDKIAEVLIDRESKLQQLESSIGTDETNRNMTLSLTIPAPLVPNIPNKQSSIDGYLGSKKNKRTVYKQLFPLITYYREIWPKENELAIPFTSKENRKINNTTELQRPFIETVARIRLVTEENANSEDEKNRQENQLQSLKNNLANSDYEKIVSKFQSLKAADVLELFIINKIFLSIEQLANKWVEIRKKQQLAAKQDIFDILIKTTSSKSSPLGKRISVSTDLTLRKEGSDVGNRIAFLKKREAEEEAILSLLPSDIEVDKDDIRPKTAITSNTALGSLLNEFTDILSYNLEQIRKEIQREEAIIKKNIQGVEQLRLEVDMMTGEFSGLSIPDIVAVVAGLFLITKQDLIALLDKETVDAMKKDTALKSAIEKYNVQINPTTAYAAVKKLEDSVTNVFKTMNLLVDVKMNKDKRSKRSGKRREKKQEKTEVSLSGRTSESTK